MADTRNKRKFDDSGPNVSYNRVPPPPSDFEKARQKALEIAARISAEAPDSAREDNVKHDDKSNIIDLGHKIHNTGPSTLNVELAKQRAQQILARFAVQDSKRSHSEEDEKVSQQDERSIQAQISGNLFQTKKPEFTTGGFYGSHGPPESRKVEIPNAKVGLVIGKGGDTIKQIQLQSGARVQITKDMDHNPNLPFRTVELMGTPEQIERAETLIHDLIADADAGAANATHTSYTPVGEQVQLTVPTNKVGLIIGRGGETIKGLQSRTGARIQLVPLHGPPEYQSGVTERVLSLMGSKEQVDAASELIKELISENRARTPIVQPGAYNQGYAPPPGPPQWNPAVQPQSYGYQQGSYYAGPPQAYGSFPPPPHAAWSQPLGAPAQQYPPGSYAYYNQQVDYSQNPQTTGYEQQGMYSEHPPGASQDVYGQQIPGQPDPYGHMGQYTAPYGSLEATYGPPGVPQTTNPQDSSHEAYGPPGVGEPATKRQATDNGPPGVGQDGGDAEHPSHQGFGTAAEDQGGVYSYNDSNTTNYVQQDYGPPGSSHPNGQMAGQINYGHSGAGYWDGNTVSYGYTGYESYQSAYGQQVPEQGGVAPQHPYEHQQNVQPESGYGGTPSISAYSGTMPDSSYPQEVPAKHSGEEEGACEFGLSNEESKTQDSGQENGRSVHGQYNSDSVHGTHESHHPGGIQDHDES
ncbi:hypothetical protein KP509_03G027700 [Ceratopteris richardii]|nr:hypothetical protein KP509_03G027700 [Ceratopteris richardii]